MKRHRGLAGEVEEERLTKTEGEEGAQAPADLDRDGGGARGEAWAELGSMVYKGDGTGVGAGGAARRRRWRERGDGEKNEMGKRLRVTLPVGRGWWRRAHVKEMAARGSCWGRGEREEEEEQVALKLGGYRAEEAVPGHGGQRFWVELGVAKVEERLRVR